MNANASSARLAEPRDSSQPRTQVAPTRGVNLDVVLSMQLRALQARLHACVDWAYRFVAPPTAPMDLYTTLLNLASISSTGQRTAYASLCLHVAEQLESSARSGFIAPRILELLCDWSMLSLRHLRSAHRENAIELVKTLTDAGWERPLGSGEGVALLEELVAEGYRLASTR